MYYFEDTQNRERNVTRDLAQIHLSTVAMAMELIGKGFPLTEVPKSIYGAKGDVDLLIYYEPESENEALIACEIKTMHLTADGKLKSIKAKKSKKQLINLKLDGFDYVWLLEFIVTEPANSWFHPQAGDALSMESAIVEEIEFGHAKFQIGAVSGKAEFDGGSISWKVVQPAKRLPKTTKRERLLEAVRTEVMKIYGNA